MSLQDWLRNGWVIEHRTSREEIASLMGIVDRDLRDCRTQGLSADWRLSIAYNAALQAATAYRPTRESHHYRVIQSLAHTLGTPGKLILQFDSFRKKRNIGGYDHAGTATDQEAEEILALASELRDQVLKWLRSHHRELL